MVKLMKLELERTNLSPYSRCSAVFFAIIIAFTYFVALVAKLEHEVQFQNYENIFRFTNAIAILLFGVLSAAMYSRFVIEEYSGKRLALLFSYPVSRRRIFAAKIAVVLSFILGAMLFCTIIPIAVFSITEAIHPIVAGEITGRLLSNALTMALLSVIAVSAIGLLAMRIGFIKKSVSHTLISAFILCGIYGNIAVSSMGNPKVSLLVAAISLAVILLVPITLSGKINKMEAE